MLLITLRLYSIPFFYGSRIILKKNVINVFDLRQIGLNSVQYMTL